MAVELRPEEIYEDTLEQIKTTVEYTLKGMIEERDALNMISNFIDTCRIRLDVEEELTSDDPEKEITTMSPYHPKWSDFLTELKGPEACNLRKEDNDSVFWDCGNDFSNAIEIMNNMEGVNIDNSIVFFKEHGAHCDCEIFLKIV